MNELQGQRAEIDTKLNNQLNTIANQIDSQAWQQMKQMY